MKGQREQEMEQLKSLLDSYGHLQQDMSSILALKIPEESIEEAEEIRTIVANAFNNSVRDMHWIMDLWNEMKLDTKCCNACMEALCFFEDAYKDGDNEKMVLAHKTYSIRWKF